jgi:hypothetical protein
VVEPTLKKYLASSSDRNSPPRSEMLRHLQQHGGPLVEHRPQAPGAPPPPPSALAPHGWMPGTCQAWRRGQQRPGAHAQPGPAGVARPRRGRGAGEQRVQLQAAPALRTCC